MANQTSELTGPLGAVTSGRGGATFVECMAQPGQKWRLSNYYEGQLPSVQDINRVVTLYLEEVPMPKGDKMWFVASIATQDGRSLSGPLAGADARQPAQTSAPAPASAPTPAPPSAPSPPLVQAAQQNAERVESRSPADHYPGSFPYRDLAIAAMNSLNNAAHVVAERYGNLAPIVDEPKTSQVADEVTAVATKFLDWYADQLAMSTWGHPEPTREPVADGPPPHEEAP